MLTERGTFFGYGRLVNDFIGLGDLMELGEGTEGRRDGEGGGSPPVCFDVTHSTQLPGAGEQTGGRPERSGLLARAATAAGVDALFIECHPEPRKAMSDSATMMGLGEVRGLLEVVAGIRGALK
jgi:2-dehydro-3-deoxyphosphooctonate aldolase (KDO 8-P synthase)